MMTRRPCFSRLALTERPVALGSTQSQRSCLVIGRGLVPRGTAALSALREHSTDTSLVLLAASPICRLLTQFAVSTVTIRLKFAEVRTKSFDRVLRNDRGRPSMQWRNSQHGYGEAVQLVSCLLNIDYYWFAIDLHDGGLRWRGRSSGLRRSQR